MQIELGPELEEFRQEIRSWIAEHRQEEVAALDERGLYGRLARGRDGQLASAYKAWEQACADARLICAQWPEELGGRGFSGIQMAILNEELARARMPRVTRGMGESLVGPSIIVHATEEQKAHFLP